MPCLLAFFGMGAGGKLVAGRLDRDLQAELWKKRGCQTAPFQGRLERPLAFLKEHRNASETLPPVGRPQGAG